MTLQCKGVTVADMLFSKENPNTKSLENRLQQLVVQVEGVEGRLDRLERSQRELDAEMASLWEKVSHALSRLGGRSRKAARDNGEPEPAQRELLAGNPLARRLLGRV